MRPATAALQALLASWGPDVDIQMADLYSFTLQGGEVLRYSSFQTALSAPAPNTDTPLLYFALGPPIERTKISEKIGVEVSHIDVTVFAGPDDLLTRGSNMTWQAALHAGLFDGAWCRVWRAYITPANGPDGAIVVGTISRFFGLVGDVEVGRTKTRIQVNGLTDLLSVQMPRRLFQAGCMHIFGQRDASGDAVGMCGYDRVAGKNALGAATGIGQQIITCIVSTDNLFVSDRGIIYTRFAPSPSTAYDNGSIIGVTGANAGYTRTIGQLVSDVWADGIGELSAIYYLKPWIFPVVAGTDTFQLLPGCDHTLPTCTNTFQNQMRYGGFPDIPPPESAI